jgi:hypothetical protein
VQPGLLPRGLIALKLLPLLPDPLDLFVPLIERMAGTGDHRSQDRHGGEDREDDPGDSVAGVVEGQPVERAEHQPRAVRGVADVPHIRVREKDADEEPGNEQFHDVIVAGVPKLGPPAPPHPQQAEQAVADPGQAHAADLRVQRRVEVVHQEGEHAGDTAEQYQESQETKRAEARFQYLAERQKPIGVERHVDQIPVQQRGGEGTPPLAGPDRRKDAQSQVVVIEITPLGIERTGDLQGHGDGRNDQ